MKVRLRLSGAVWKSVRDNAISVRRITMMRSDRPSCRSSRTWMVARRTPRCRRWGASRSPVREGHLCLGLPGNPLFVFMLGCVYNTLKKVTFCVNESGCLFYQTCQAKCWQQLYHAHSWFARATAHYTVGSHSNPRTAPQKGATHESVWKK